MLPTSGWPSESKNASGTDEEAAVLSEVGLAEYSVSGMPLGTPFVIDLGDIITHSLRALVESGEGNELEV